jgi:(E)-4-hydroxy-3-methyl-but-2-enyl pyrophosphate reductase
MDTVPSKIYSSHMGKLVVATGSTFCPGATRALGIARESLSCGNGRVYSFGALVHNGPEIARLTALGLEVIDPDGGLLPELEGVQVVLRAHGIDSRTEELLRSRGAVLVDTTCPTVKDAQDAVISLRESGCEVLLLGSASHPEVIAIVGRAGGEVTVIESVDGLDEWIDSRETLPDRVGVACQTTLRQDLFDSVVETLRPLVGELEVRDTLCPHVLRRREEALGLCARANVMIVVGGRNSSNTTNLAGICEKSGVKTYRVESAEEVMPEWVAGASVVGVTGGASTPDWSMSEVIDRLRDLGLDG